MKRSPDSVARTCHVLTISKCDETRLHHCKESKAKLAVLSSMSQLHATPMRQACPAHFVLLCPSCRGCWLILAAVDGMTSCQVQLEAQHPWLRQRPYTGNIWYMLP
jgi:hypothetical protein